MSNLNNFSYQINVNNYLYIIYKINDNYIFKRISLITNHIDFIEIIDNEITIKSNKPNNLNIYEKEIIVNDIFRVMNESYIVKNCICLDNLLLEIKNSYNEYTKKYTKTLK